MSTKKKLLCLFVGVAFALTFAGCISGRSGTSSRPIVLKSPDGSVAAGIFISDSGRLSYNLKCGDRIVIMDSPLGITVDGSDLGKAVELGKPTCETVREKYPCRGVKAESVNHYKGMSIPVRLADKSSTWTLEVRTFNDGAAFRYIVPGNGRRNVSGETTGFCVPVDSTAWFQEDSLVYESPHKEMAVGAIKPGPVIMTPFVFRLPGAAGYAAVAETSADNYCGAGLVREDNNLFRMRLFGPVTATGSITSAWRVILLAKDLNALVNSDIIGNLAPPPDPALFPQGVHTPWVKPGRCVWSWLGGGGVTYKNMKRYNELAPQIGATYNLVDEGWNRWSTNDQTCWSMLSELAADAATRGVGLWIWKAYPDRAGIPGIQTSERWNAFFDKCVAARIVGIKIDFFDSESQEVIANQHGLLRAAAERKLLVNLHGTPKPAGESRTYPNELTREGVRGLENGGPDPWQTVVLPFTRFIAGHADYTPLNLRQTTPANQVANLIVFTSPLTCYAANPEAILKHPCAGIITNIPTVWDETIVLPASEIGRMAAFARRSGTEWFIGVMNGPCATNLMLEANFLPAGTWQAACAQDGTNGIVMREIKPGIPLDLKLEAGGGFAAWLQRAAN